MTYTTVLFRIVDIVVFKFIGIWLSNYQGPKFAERPLWSKKPEWPERVVSRLLADPNRRAG